MNEIYKTPEVILNYIRQHENVVKVKTEDVKIMTEIKEFLVNKGYLFSENDKMNKCNFYKGVEDGL